MKVKERTLSKYRRKSMRKWRNSVYKQKRIKNRTRHQKNEVRSIY
jgi:hypothetical protein